MAILYDASQRIFTLQTMHTTYQMQADGFGHLLHLYYGPRIEGSSSYMLQMRDRGFHGNPSEAGGPDGRGRDRTCSLDTLPQEYPCAGSGDQRQTALAVRDEDGVSGCRLRYRGHEVLPGKYGLPGLPAVHAAPEDAETLRIDLADEEAGVEVSLWYGVLAGADVITRAAEIRASKDRRGNLYVNRAASACVDWMYDRLDTVTFAGRYGRERIPQRQTLGQGRYVIESRRGHSGHALNPFMILCDRDAGETHGRTWGFLLLYSGSFSAGAEVDPLLQTRFVMGIGDEQLDYPLAPGESFFTPECAMCCSEQGFGILTHRLHRLVRTHIVRGEWAGRPRPILFNSWEAAYFRFTGETIVRMGMEAAELGAELLVMDDGWFGKRDDDTSGLGDWYPNEEKLGMSLAKLSEKIHGTGLQFGLWIEPEMVSEDSDLYRAHPDWAMKVPGRAFTRSRSQLVLDFTRREVRDEIFARISAVLDSAKIEYVKIDCNRSLSDVYSAGSTWQNRGTLEYRYMLGVYDFLEKLTARYPQILFEGCCGGGGRFDAGMLYYTPQIWCSDNTDAVERLQIQYGSSFAYPAVVTGAHVSACPNAMTGRTVPLRTRAAVAMSATFGYELNPSGLTIGEKEEIRRQIQDVKRFRTLAAECVLYRLVPPVKDAPFTAWAYVSEDRRQCLMTAVLLDPQANAPAYRVRLCGLDPDRSYLEEENGEIYTGRMLMECGVPLTDLQGEYGCIQIYLQATYAQVD